MLAVRDAIPKARDLAKAEFATLRLKLLKIAARVVEMASPVRSGFRLARGRALHRPRARFSRREGEALILGGRIPEVPRRVTAAKVRAQWAAGQR